MVVWRHQRLHRRSAKVYCSGFHVEAMSKRASGALANEQLGLCEQGEVPAGRVLCRRPPETHRFGFTSLIGLPVQAPQGRNSARRQPDAEVWKSTEISPWNTLTGGI